jgi:hypothetical protein
MHIPLSLFSHKRKSGVFERRLHTDELDAAIGVRKAETGYRDTWRIWLAGDTGEGRQATCRSLKERRLFEARMVRPLLWMELRSLIPAGAHGLDAE